MRDYIDTMPVVPHRFDADTVARFREHEGEVSDEHDAARDYEAEDGRADEGAGAVVWGAVALLVVMLLVSLFADRIVEWLR